MPDERPTRKPNIANPVARSRRVRPRETYATGTARRHRQAERRFVYRRSVRPRELLHRSAATDAPKPPDRYEAYRTRPIRPAGPPPPSSRPLPAGPMNRMSGAAAAALPAVDLMSPLLAGGTARRRRWPPAHPWRWAFIGIPLALLLVAAIVIGPILYQSQRAYREVFVAPVTHDVSNQVAVLNSAGTPVLAKPKATKAPEWTGTERLTILLIGVDHPEGGASRTDTIILVNIDPVTKKAAMLAIPRDLKVVIPGYGINKINAAFALGEYNKLPGGGAGLLIRTIEANLGIPVASFAQIDFGGFTKMIDTVGGVTVDVPYPIKDDAYPADNYQYQRIYFHAGWQHLDGTRALEYARTRHQDTDAGRSRRQEQILLALRQKAISLNLLTKAPDLIREFGDTVRTDISPSDALRLARLASQMPQANISQYSLFPALQEQQLPNQPYYLIADWSQVGQILGDFTGTPVNPPGAALANPNYNLPILVRNGTANKGLAGRVAQVLQENGFTDVAVADAPSPAAQTTILDRGGNLGTSAVVTSLVGVGGDHITVTSLPSGNGTPFALSTPQAGTPTAGYAIVVTLGNDAPDPADVSLNNADYQQQVGTDVPPANATLPVDNQPPPVPGATQPAMNVPPPTDTTGNTAVPPQGTEPPTTVPNS